MLNSKVIRFEKDPKGWPASIKKMRRVFMS